MFLVPITYNIKEKPSPKIAIDMLFSRETPDEHLIKLFPSNSSLLNFEIKEGIACLDLSREIEEGLQPGGLEAIMMISSINYTLSHFNEIKGIKFLVEGEPLEVLGELDLSGVMEIDKWKNLYLTGMESRVPGDENRAVAYFLVPRTSFLVPVTSVYDNNGENLPLSVIKHLSTGLNDGWAEGTLPEGSEVLSFVLEENVAHIDFNSKFLNLKSENSGKIILESLVLSLTEFENIKEISLTVEGKPLKKYGTLDLSENISRPPVNFIDLKEVNS